METEFDITIGDAEPETMYRWKKVALSRCSILSENGPRKNHGERSKGPSGAMAQMDHQCRPSAISAAVQTYLLLVKITLY